MAVPMITELTGGSVVTDAGTLVPFDVVIRGGRITELRSPDRRRSPGADSLDVTGKIVAPGLVDVQINGGWGHDFTGDPTTIGDVARWLPSTGVTAFVPTIVTSSATRRTAALEALARLEQSDDRASALGIHFEGPIISPECQGAHDPERIGFPPPAELDRWNRERGLAIVTIAPEVPGAIELIAELVARGVVVSIGHTACSVAEFAEARTAGASMVTHLFNAMAPFTHRRPGPIGAALADDDVYAGIICDGIHADPVAVRLAWKALGPDHLILVSDAVAALGLGFGTVRLGDFEVTISERGVRTGGDVLAGSNLPLDQAVRNLVEFTGCSPARAIRAASANPADLLGLDDRGRIGVGAIADLVVFDQDLHVERTIIEGHTAWKS